MRCKSVSKYFLPFYDSNLKRIDSRRLKVHLNICSSCRKEYDAFTSTIKALKRLEEVSPSPDFDERLNKKIIMDEREGDKKRTPKLFLKSFWENLLFSPERFWLKISAGILAICFISLIQFPWHITSLDYPIIRCHKIKGFVLKEISLNYNFFEIGIENKNGNITFKMYIGT